MVKTELQRAFFSKAFWITCGIAFVMLAIGGADYINYAVHPSKGIVSTWWEVYICSLAFGMTSLLSVFYPIIVMIPYVLSYRRERDSGYRQLILLKTSKRAYLGAKMLAVAVSAFASMLFPNLCWMLVCRLALGETDPIYEDFRHMIDFALLLYDNHPGWYMVMYAVHASVLGAIFAIAGLGLSAVIKNRYLALFLPFCYCVFSSSVLSSIDNSFAAFDLLPIQLCQFGALGYWGIPIYETVLLAVGLGLFLGGDYHAGKA